MAYRAISAAQASRAKTNLKSLPVTKRQWQQKMIGAKKSMYRNIGRGKSGSQTRMRQANDLQAIRSGKVYKFKKG